MLLALVAERLARPAGEALAQPEPGEPRHQVELGGIGVADRDRVEADATLVDDDVLRVHALLAPAVAAHLELNALELDVERADTLAPVEAGKIRDERLDDEDAAVGKDAGDVREAPHLVLLGEKPEQRVEDEIDERVRAIHADVREVAHRHADPVAARLRAEPRDHRFGRVDAVHLEPALEERQRDPARTDGELEHGATAGELDEERDSLGRVAWQRDGLVVDVRDSIAVGRRPVAPHQEDSLSDDYTRPVGTISFARGIPGPDLLPVDEFGECAREAARNDGARALNYGPPAGYPPLRDWIAAEHDVDPERVVVTNGSLQGFNFLARRLVAEGATVFVEAPCYDRSLGILRALGATVEAVPQREDGLDVDELARRLERIRGRAVVYTIPTFQNPSGRTLSRENRGRLLALVEATSALVVEDDPYRLLRFAGEPLPTLFELAGGDGVVFQTSFSKTVAPGIRVGYLVLPEDLVPAIEELVLQNYVSPAIFVQAALYEFVTSGRYEPNVERVSAALRERCARMRSALARELPEGAEWSDPEGGYFLWLDLPGVESRDLFERAREADVTFVKGSDLHLAGGGEESARLAFSFAPLDEIDEGVARLGRLVRAAAAVPA